MRPLLLVVFAATALGGGSFADCSLSEGGIRGYTVEASAEAPRASSVAVALVSSAQYPAASPAPTTRLEVRSDTVFVSFVPAPVRTVCSLAEVVGELFLEVALPEGAAIRSAVAVPGGRARLRSVPVSAPRRAVRV